MNIDSNNNTSAPPPQARGRPRGSSTPRRGRRPRGSLPGGSAHTHLGSNPMPPPSAWPGSMVFSGQAQAAVPPVASSSTSPNAAPTTTASTATAAVAAAANTTAVPPTQTAHLASSSTSISFQATHVGMPQPQLQAQSQPQPQSQIQTQPQPRPPVQVQATTQAPLLHLPGIVPQATPASAPAHAPAHVPADDADAEDDMEILPAMADDDYSAQLSWQSQSKDNLKVLMDNFSPEQYERFEAYRRHALPKQAVRKVVQQMLGQQISQPVAQIVAGFAKVFVGEIIERARAVQMRRGDKGPLEPDHLREAYRMYQEETGRVGAARPLRSKRIFVK